MTIAEQLAEAIGCAQTKLASMTATTQEKLIKHRDTLQHLSHLPVDEQGLAQQCAEATGTAQNLRSEVERLTAERDEVKAEFDHKLREVHERLIEIYNSKAAQIRASTVTSDLQQAMLAFSSELEKISFPVERAPLAQQLKQLPLLARMAASARAKAANEAKAASQLIEKMGELGKKIQALSNEDLRLKQEWESLRKRLQQHYRADESGILADIENLDLRLAKRLKQEILVPKLNDARIEREKGLIGIDPLKEIQSLK